MLTLAPFVGACEPGVAPSEDPQLIEPTPTAVTPPGPPPATPSANDGRWLMAYYVGYERSLLPPADIEWANLTHLAVGAVLPKADGTLDTTYAIDRLPVKGPAMAKESWTWRTPTTRRPSSWWAAKARTTGGSRRRPRSASRRW